MHLPTFPRAMPVTRRVQTDFRGYDHRPGCPEGGIYEMTNGSAADAPLFSTRPGRTLTYPTGGSANGLFAVDGGLLWCTGQTLYFNGTPVDGCTLVNGPKVFAELGGTVLIWPDKVWYRPDMGKFGSAEPSWSGTVALQRSNDSSGARADSVAANGIDTPFRVGDAVTFSGFSTPEDNGTYIIRAIAGAVLVFDPDTFSAVGAVEHITVTRRMPMALHACTYANRIWACAQDTVWCTKLGDPLSWYWYEADENGTVATAAWSVDVGTPGNFSGCAATGSGVVFLKPDTACTRAQIVKILYNLSGNQTDYSYYYLPFTDVAPGAWYYNAIAWAYCNDVTSGTSATTFTPNAAITRQQLVTFLYRYTVKYAPEFTGNAAPISAFPDAGSVANWAYAAMSWAVGNGLIQGNAHDNGLDYLDPNGSATRAQTATIIMRYCQLIGA